MVHQDLVHLAGADLLAAAIDDLLQAPGDAQVALVVRPLSAREDGAAVGDASLDGGTTFSNVLFGVFNSGGWHFRDSFGEAHAPFHWDVQISGTDMDSLVAFIRTLSGTTSK